ncbi:hypothetical protein B1A99_18940 [Cohnella sp. CIP 111063]|uniref:toll/interleukin-1 receptor domain-containing protein n=1 Tax=unclassified Cohnella TaxID=2636738 RepID=UPI000B8C3AF3|nr:MULTISPECIES: toll/interleukin-1 receptor domain-containing protein [unclassified Cohnella]OXS56936.1 hypothetical protein B1A99_18940 [Cohnella sp. CIP 111063]PRX69779.1 SEFIR domain-containing protein [Cohnella sp. SGD-V74]
MTKNNITPSVFISYSWTSQSHENWVTDLARRLRKDGVYAVIDKWRLKAGHDRFAFMEEMIGSEDIHKVLVICDKGYKDKANQRIGGVGVETQVITSSIYTKVRQEKFIPVLAERGEDGAEFIPTFMSSLIYIDLSNPSCYETGYKQLLYAIFETAEHEEPELGNIPEFILQKKIGLQENTEFSAENQNEPIVEFFEPGFTSDDTSHKHSIKNVSLTAFLPNKYDSASCLVSFVKKEISGCKFTLHGQNLIQTFFQGIGTPANECKRRFLVGFDEKTATYTVQFPHNRFHLNSDEVEELCKIIDDFYPYYLKSMRNYLPAKSNTIANVKDLHDLVLEIQSYYTVHRNLTLAVDVKKAYEALKLALFRSKLTDEVFGYISSKLVLKELTKDNICLKITEHQNTLSIGYCHNWEVDMILRSLVVLLRDCRSLLSIDEIKEIVVLLRIFEDTKDLFDSNNVTANA